MKTDLLNTYSRSIGMPEKLKLYRKIFGDYPWEEGYICSNCGKQYPLTYQANCNCNNPVLKPFYSPFELKSKFNLISQIYGYKEFIAQILDKPVGFIWGRQTNLINLNEDKFGLNQESLEELETNLRELYHSFNSNNFYYLSEIGVMKDNRGKDIAGNLYRNFIEELNNLGNKYIVVRTTRKSDVPYQWFKKIGYKDVYFYKDEQDRVILVLNLEKNDTSN